MQLAYHAQLRTQFPQVFCEIQRRARNIAVECLNNKRKGIVNQPSITEIREAQEVMNDKKIPTHNRVRI